MVGSEGVCVFSPLVTGEEWAVIPAEIAKKIENFFTEKVQEFITSKALLETNRFNAEQSLSEVREKLDKVTEENESLKARFEVATSTITTFEQQISSLNAEFSKSQSTCRRLEEEAAEFRHQRNLAVDERDEHLKMLQRRNAEVERMQSDIKSLMEQLETAINTKCEALSKADAVESMKLTLEYKEKRIEQERSLLKSQVESLTEELHSKTEELLNMRRDNTSRCIQLEAKLSEKTQELEVAVEQVKSLTELNNSLSERMEELVKQLSNQRDTEGKIGESYLQEIDAKTKLANAYQQMYEENKKYAEGLKEALDETQELLKNATDKYGDLETQHKESELAHEEIINKKNEYISILKNELEKANGLLDHSNQFKLQKDMEELSPTAATTSNILKSGMTFTELYSKYVAMSDKVLTLQEENARLNHYINSIVKEIEEKGPFIKKIKDDYAKLMDAHDELKLNNDSLLIEVQQLRENNAECRRLENATARENDRLQKDVADLSRQVCHLLQEVEQCRMGSSLTSPEMDFADSFSSADIITKKLVVFNDIQELQQNNRKLLSLVRELSEKQEEAEAFDPANFALLKSKLDDLREQQQELLEEKEKQYKMLETLKNQRDMYKNLYAQAVKANGDDTLLNLQESMDVSKITKDSPDSQRSDEKLVRDLENQLESLKKEMEQIRTEKDSYKEEKLANEKMLDEQLTSLRKENKDLTKLNCKLVAQSEVNEEKFKVMKNNMEVLKKQITALEKQNKIFNDSILKHEQTVNYLRDDAMEAHSKLSKAEVMLGNIEKENSLLRDSEARARREYESMKQQYNSQHLIQSNIELIKATLERTDSEGKLRLEARLDEAHRECSALRRRLQEEQDRFRQLTDHLQAQTQNAVKRCEEEKAEADKLRKELGELREELAAKNDQVEELTKKIKMSILAIPESHGEGRKIRHLEEQLENSQSEIDTLKAKLKAAKEASDQYFNIAEDAEKQMKMAVEKQEEFKAEIEKHKNTIKELQEKCSELEGELSIQMDDQDMASVGNKAKHTQLEEELNVRSLDLQSSQEQLENCRSECKSLIENLKIVENKYAREVMLHSADLQALTEMKETLNKIQNEMAEVKMARDNALSELESSKESWKKQEEYLLKDKSDLENRLKDLDAQNNLLLSQMESLNSQLTILQTQVSSDNVNQSMNDSSSSFSKSFAEDEVKSSEQLLKVIKYLRQEKDVAVSKSEILEAEHSRMKSKLEMVTKQLEEMKQVVENERQRNEISVVTASKHAEVLRKVETLNAITDSNRSLRQERDNLLTQVTDLRARTDKLEAELAPLQEKNIELATKAEAMQTENVSLRAEYNRWRQRANLLIEKSNRTSPEDWKKLQNERDNLSKQLTIEKSNIVKLNDEMNTLRQEKSKLDEQLKSVRSQSYQQGEELGKVKEEIALLRTQISSTNTNLEQLQEQNKKLTEETKSMQEEGVSKDATINELKNNLTQVRKIAKKYKIQCEDQTKEMETLKQQQAEQKESLQSETSQREEQIKNEHQLELEERLNQMEQVNKEVIEQLNQKVREMTEENENQKREIEKVNKSSLEKEERFKQLFKNAKDRIVTLTEHNKELKEELKNQDRPGKSGDSSNGEMLAKIEALLKEKDEMMAEHLQEKEKMNAEMDVLTQKLTQLQRQLGLQQGSKPSTSSGTAEKSTTEPPTANIKPMAGHSTNTQTQSVPIQPWRNAGETPLASIRPMSAQLRTVAVLPTSQSPSAVMVPPQQQVHTTGSSNSIEALSSSPTSSHTDYVPATSSASSAMLGPRQAAVPPSQSSQDAEDEDSGVQVHTAPQQQAVALVLPRVEPPSGSSSSSSSSSTGPTQEQGTSSSSNTVTTSQVGHKRQRDSDTEACQADDQGKTMQQCKRTRLQQTGTVSDSVLEVEYQVPTSSQRDHDDDNVIVLESDEDGGADEGEGADDEPDDPDTEGYDIEAMEQDNYEEADCPEEEEEAGNEVEVIDDSSEVPNQSERSAAESHSQEESAEQPQSEAISSGTDGTSTSSGVTISQASPSVPSATMSMFSRSSRPIPSLARPQQSHLLLPHMEEGGDDGIVPSTPTLFVPRRSDAFGEAVSSPHVPSGRFIFSDTAPPSTSGSVGAVPEQTLEVINVDENSTGRSVPSTPLQSSPQEAIPGAEEQPAGPSSQPDELPTITISEAEETEQVSDGGAGDMGPPAVAGTSSEGMQAEEQGEEMMEADDEVSSEGEKPPATEEGEEEGREAEASPSTNGRPRNTRGMGVARRQTRNMGNRGFQRSGPTPIVWGEHRQGSPNQQQRLQGHPPPNFNRMARRSRGRSPFRRF
ncbi:nucleoprotein TPR isoform X2 [Coccinella septempunctata]|uniref:nucleoprotein TPR isoform X2 n=1 Tax=Coccinella septempunctata TaxID=41139 RepID=UPI001D067CF5|nr:nucleoprotein TPR isoform X2 [Coccinella septempunctata]